MPRSEKVMTPVVIVALVLIFLLSALLIHREMGQMTEAYLEDYQTSAKNIDQMQQFLFYQAQMVPEYLTELETLPEERFQSNFSSFVRYYQAEYSKAASQEAKDILYRVSTTYYKYIDSFTTFQEYVEEDNFQTAYFYCRLTLLPDMNSAYAALQVYREYVEGQRDAEADRIFLLYRALMLLLAGLFALLTAAIVLRARHVMRQRLLPLEEMAEERQKFENSRAHFFASVSHELKTPLTSIVMGAELLQNPAMGELNEDQKELVSTIMEDSFTLTALITNMLQMTKAEASQSIYLFENCNILEIIDQSISQFERIALKKHVRFTFGCPNSIPPIRADKDKLIWVMNNLLSNAFKYSQAGDSIHISADFYSDYFIVVRVSDMGPGIPPEYTEKIFDKYVQVGEDETELGGTGLGLAICKDIVTAHEGTIWYEDNHPKGSLFSFTIPVVKGYAMEQ